MKSLNLFFLSFLFAFSVHATSEIQESPFSYKVTTELFHYSYEETSDGRFFMENKGTLGGVNCEANYHSGLNTIGLSARFAFGNTDYRSHGAGHMQDDPYHYYETRLIHGYRFTATPCFDIRPFWGLGYRYLVNDSSGRFTSTGYHYGYFRSTKYFYIPLGAEMTYQLGCDSRLKMDLEFDFLLVGFQRSELLSATLTNTQHDGHGFRLGLAYEHDFERFSLGIKPFIRYWCVDDSDVVFNHVNGLFYREPHNVTKEIGLGVSFRF